GLWPILRGGLRIDAAQIAMLAGVPALLGPWIGHYPWADDVVMPWFLLTWFFIVLMEVSTPQFIAEYDTRPNRLYVQYLTHPKEVFGLLWRGYRLAICSALVLMAILMWAGFELFDDGGSDPQLLWWQKVLYTLAVAVVVFVAIRGTLAHRPINPSTVAYC